MRKFAIYSDSEMSTDEARVDVLHAYDLITSTTENLTEQLNDMQSQISDKLDDIISVSNELDKLLVQADNLEDSADLDVPYPDIEEVPGFMELADGDDLLEEGYDLWREFMVKFRQCQEFSHNLSFACDRMKKALTDLQECINLRE